MRFQMNSTTTAPTMAPMKPAPWSARYQPTAWPMKVATKAPAMPSAVVSRKPVGLLGPARQQASDDAGDEADEHDPQNAHDRPLLDAVPASRRRGSFRRRVGRRPCGRELIDDLGQLLAEARQQFLARQAGLRRQEVDLLGRQHLAEVGRRDRLVLAGADPRLGDVALAGILELLEQVAQPAAQDARPGRRCRPPCRPPPRPLKRSPKPPKAAAGRRSVGRQPSCGAAPAAAR